MGVGWGEVGWRGGEGDVEEGGRDLEGRGGGGVGGLGGHGFG